MKTPTDEQPAVFESRIQIIPRANLVRWKDNPRQVFDDTDLSELEQSIEQHGFLPNWPLLVRPVAELRIREDSEGGAPWYVLEIKEPNGEWAEIDGSADPERAAMLLSRERRFEIIDGERRDRIAEKRGIDELPCVIRMMSDAEALEIALVSTLQKKGLNALEEAQSFHRLDSLLLAADSDSTDRERYTEMARKVGRSETHVRRMLSLFRLHGEAAGEALKSGRLPVAQAELIASLPTPALRAELTKQVLNRSLYGEGVMPREHLRVEMKRYQRELRGSRFEQKDEALVPVRTDAKGQRIAGGACTDCPFNTRNVDTGEAGSKMHCCLNTACFDEKVAADHEQWRQAVSTATGSVTALSYEDNAALWDEKGKRLAASSRYVEIEEIPAQHEVKTDVNLDPEKHTWRKLMKGRGVPVVLGRDEDGKVHELALHELAARAARENKHKIFRDEEAARETKERELAGAPRPSTADPDAVPAVEAAMAAEKREQQAAAEREAREAEAEEVERVFNAQVTALARSIEETPELPKGFFAILFESLSGYFMDGESGAFHRRGVDPITEQRERYLKKASDNAIAALLVEAIINQGEWDDPGLGEHFLLTHLGKLYRTDLKGAAKQALAQLKAERAQAAEVAEIQAGMEWKDQLDHTLSNRGVFTFNPAQVCENPELCTLRFAKGSKISATIKTALLQGTKNEWVVGFMVNGPKFARIEPCAATATKYGTRNAAVRTGLLGIKQHLADQGGDNGAYAAEIARIDAWLDQIGAPPEKPAKKAAKKMR